MLIISVMICIRLLKNIAPAEKFIFMGMKSISLLVCFDLD